MRRIVVVFAIMTWTVMGLGCQGGKESAKQPATSSGYETEPTGGAAGAVGKALEKMADPSVAGCLEKVKARQFTEALPLCLKAANLEPQNQEVSSALSAARSGAADVASMQQQAGESLGAVKDAGKAADAAKGLVPPVAPKMPSMPKMP